MRTDAFAPAKVNLALHVTGKRANGYHLLDSLVAFADVGDRISVSPAPTTSLTVTGPRAAGVPADARNLVWRAADLHGTCVAITLDKHLPAAAGIGGGSSDAAATLRALRELTGRTHDFDPLSLGADLPVCLHARATRMQGIGETLHAVDLPSLAAVLVNPGVEVPTGPVFATLPSADNSPMTDPPSGLDRRAFLDWLGRQRNDLQSPALALQPVIARVIDALSDATLVRMSGSGATCFGLYPDRAVADRTAQRIAALYPDWWTVACTLR